MKTIFLLLVILFAMIIGVAIAKNSLKNNIPLFNTTPTATINNHKFNLEIAKTAKEKEIGLSEKKSFPQDSGMLFPFDKADYYSFWMKNMKLPIDIIFIKNGAIVTIIKDATPPTSANINLPIYQPKSPADSVLEINSGLSSKYAFVEGNKVKLENIK